MSFALRALALAIGGGALALGAVRYLDDRKRLDQDKAARTATGGGEVLWGMDRLAAMQQPTAARQSGPDIGKVIGMVGSFAKIFGGLSSAFQKDGGGGGGTAPAPRPAPATGGVVLGGGSGPAGVNFTSYEKQYGLPSGYLHRTAQIESAMNPKAQNPNSSAGGLFQFIDSTARAYGLTDKFDPAASTDAASRLAADNARYLRGQLGREPTAAELYLAHQQGAGGAAKLLANPNAPAASVVGANAVRLNGGNTGMTAGEFANLWLRKF